MSEGNGGVSLTAKVAIKVNTTGAAIDDNTNDLHLPAGPYLKVEISAADPDSTLTPTDETDDEFAKLTIAGQVLTGNFGIERVTKTDGTVLTRLTATDVSLSLGGGVVEITDGAGSFLITPGGIAGRIAATGSVRSLSVRDSAVSAGRTACRASG